MPETSASDATTEAHVRLYHGSDVAIEHPNVSLNTGFSDLGRGFYLTDDHDAATRRATSRARRQGAETGVVSVFDLDLGGLGWVVDGAKTSEPVGSASTASTVSPSGPATPFALGFEASPEGIVAWMRYIMACRKGKTTLSGLGEPAVVRAWIATEEVEMAVSGFAEPEEFASLIDPAELIVQYCIRDQAIADSRLRFIKAEEVSL